MTKRLAIYVEGQTEQVFIERLISEIAGAHNVRFSKTSYAESRIIKLDQIAGSAEEKFFVLLYDCQGESNVKSKVLEDHGKLAKNGYQLIIGLRDLHPKPLADLSGVKRFLSYGVPTAGIPIHILVAVAEVEAWFLQDASHYERISPKLDPNDFKAVFGFDPYTDSAESIGAPAALLHQIYRSAGKSYRKKRRHAERTVNALDIEFLWLESDALLPHFAELAAHVDRFMSND